MRMNNQMRMSNAFIVAAIALIVVASGSVVEAQDRDDRWEFGLGLMYQLGTDLDFDSGAAMEVDDDFGFQLDAGYNFTDNLAVKFGMQWTGVSYKADVIDENNDPLRISGKFDQMALFGDLVYYFGDSALAPYISAGIGWTWIDTNVPSGPPATGCWWDPWYGWVCYTSYPTHTKDAFSYQAGVGLRYEFNYNNYVDFGYTSQWLSVSEADSTPRFDVFSLEFGWMF